RQVVLEVAPDLGLVVREKPFSLTDVYSAEEAFVTGTFGGLTPVVSVDGRTIGDGRPGSITARLREQYQAAVEADVVG
ncbi:MAG TPA: aminotransferase class IV, partial [Acidimicrobiaceae bacterium]|nr:aminotransferase class IV [Acidimicrobiaceae bacterium]